MMRFLFFLIKYLADIISLLVPNITMFKLELASNKSIKRDQFFKFQFLTWEKPLIDKVKYFFFIIGDEKERLNLLRVEKFKSLYFGSTL